jgi:serine/threonine kinase 32
MASDYYSVGIILYELMMRGRPYDGMTKTEISEEMSEKPGQIRRADIPEGWTLEAADFTNRLLQREPSSRLGLNGPPEVQRHVWLKGFNWIKL